MQRRAHGAALSRRQPYVRLLLHLLQLFFGKKAVRFPGKGGNGKGAFLLAVIGRGQIDRFFAVYGGADKPFLRAVLLQHLLSNVFRHAQQLRRPAQQLPFGQKDMPLALCLLEHMHKPAVYPKRVLRAYAQPSRRSVGAAEAYALHPFHKAVRVASQLLLHAQAVLLQDAALHGAAEAEGLQKHGVLTQRRHLRVAAGYHIRLGFAYARNLAQTPRSAVHYIQRFRPEGIHYRPRRAGAYAAYKPGGKIFLYIRQPLGAHRAHAGGIKAKTVLTVLLPVALHLNIFPFVYCGKAAAHRGKLVVSGKLKDGVAVLLITVYYVVYAAS